MIDVNIVQYYEDNSKWVPDLSLLNLLVHVAHVRAILTGILSTSELLPH